MVEYMKNRKKYIVVTLAIIMSLLFVWVAACVVANKAISFDNTIYNLFTITDRNSFIARLFTMFGEDFMILMLSILPVMFMYNKKEAAMIPLNVCLIAGLNTLIKLLVKRPRPAMIFLTEASGYSFPSGHSSMALAFYGFILFLVITKCQSKVLKVLYFVVFSTLILGIGLSRIYLGVHYASDVLGGFLEAGVYLIGFISLYKRLFLHSKDIANGSF